MKTSVKSLVISPPGSGKTHFAGTHPKSYWMETEPGGFETVEMKGDLLKNIVKHETFIPSPLEDIKLVFDRLEKSCLEAHKMAAEGLIDTLVLDNMTYLSENRWIYINKYEKEVSTKTGNIDNQSMYGKLGRWLYQFTLINICSFPGNVVVTCHIRQESDVVMEKKVTDDSIVPDILGGFRNQAPGLFNIVMFLDKIKGSDGKYKYMARLDRSKDKLAKNRYGLPEVMENVSYKTIYDAIVREKGDINE